MTVSITVELYLSLITVLVFFNKLIILLKIHLQKLSISQALFKELNHKKLYSYLQTKLVLKFLNTNKI